MPEYQNEQLLTLWLDGKLTKQQRLAFEQRCVDDKTFAQQIETATLVSAQAQDFSEQEVPLWNMSATFTAPEKAHWWHGQGLSIAMSTLAIVLVLTGFQVRSDGDAVTISFAGKHSNSEIEHLVAEKLQTFQQNQQLVLNNFSQSLQQQQLDASNQLTQYLITSSRKERREDFAELIKFINEQRSDDQLFYARQLNQLQQDIYTNPEQARLNSSNK